MLTFNILFLFTYRVLASLSSDWQLITSWMKIFSIWTWKLVDYSVNMWFIFHWPKSIRSMNEISLHVGSDKENFLYSTLSCWSYHPIITGKASAVFWIEEYNFRANQYCKYIVSRPSSIYYFVITKILKGTPERKKS